MNPAPSMKSLSVALCYVFVSYTFAAKEFLENIKDGGTVGIPDISIGGRNSPVNRANISLDLSNFFGGLAGGPIEVDVRQIAGNPKIILSQARVNVVTLESFVKVSSPELTIFGNYSWPGLLPFTDTAGKTNITLRNFTASLSYLQTLDSLLISDIQTFVMNYEGEPIINLTDNVFFQNQRNFSMRTILEKNAESLNKQIKAMLLKSSNEEIQRFRKLFQTDNPKSLKLLLQRLIRSLDLDRIHLPDLSRSILGIDFKVTELILNGFSNINEIHTLLLEYRDERIMSKVNMTFTQTMISYKLCFLNIEFLEEKHLQNAAVSFRLLVDLKQETSPQLKDLRLIFGSLKKIKNGYVKGIFSLTNDVLMDLPDGIRQIIFQALNSILNKIIQEELNKTNLEEVAAKFIKKIGKNKI